MENLKNILFQLKTLGCSGIKVSLEDEGALMNELITMRYLTASVELELSVKIGGCEAKNDIMNCIDLCADTMVAPMIESDFALQKYLSAIAKYNYKNKKGFNLETIEGYNNFSRICNSMTECDSITFGRVDFVSSIGKDRNEVDSDSVYECVSGVFEKSKEKGLLCNMGGAINIHSKGFINRLLCRELLDYFETRYIIFDCKQVNMENYETCIYYANVFEVEWLLFIREKYLISANKDVMRIEMIQNRIDNNMFH